ncbi:MAG TPA: hypothetical protein VN442_17705 [Bryobacteraceae bacterium]|nr:hypothetical protein [Bryobacteraceae bacterium]
MEYASVTVVDAAAVPGVRLVLRRMSFARRVELMRRIRELARPAQFLRAGDRVGEQMDAGLLRAEIDRVYVEWGVERVEGLALDGVPATAQGLAEAGPEELFREALDAVKRECGLSDEERKN